MAAAWERLREATSSVVVGRGPAEAVWMLMVWLQRATSSSDMPCLSFPRTRATLPEPEEAVVPKSSAAFLGLSDSTPFRDVAAVPTTRQQSLTASRMSAYVFALSRTPVAKTA